MNNDRDTTGRGSVGMGMLRKLLEKSKNNMQKIPICFATAVPSDISKDALADYEDNYHTEIAVFSKDDLFPDNAWPKASSTEAHYRDFGRLVNLLCFVNAKAYEIRDKFCRRRTAFAYPSSR